jgi:hypothetical protein
MTEFANQPGCTGGKFVVVEGREKRMMLAESVSQEEKHIEENERSRRSCVRSFVR